VKPTALISDSANRTHGIAELSHPGRAHDIKPEDEAQAAMRTSPTAVVSLLAMWDSAGKSVNLADNPSYDHARSLMLCWVPDANCQTDEPGWDTFTVIRGYRMHPVIQQGDSAQVAVEYDVLAEGAGGNVISKHETTPWLVRLRRMDGHWRVVDPESQKAPSLSISAALRYVAHSARDSTAIQQLTQKE